uniref:CUE domain-containing protein n=1 Tax=Kalanchoe fedtschenkoi TaxID=63787 RepID=A0A7N0TUZ8_KALFE
MASDMGVNSVFMELRDFFPQVDPRILKAVAFENRTNVDAAFCVVMDEILPNIPEITILSNLGQKGLSSQSMSGTKAGDQKVVGEANATSSSDGVQSRNHGGSLVTSMSEFRAQKFLDEVSKINNAEELTSFCKGLATHLNIVPEQINGVTSMHEDLEGKHILDVPYVGEGYSSLMAEEEHVPLTGTIDFIASVLHGDEKPNENQISGNRIGPVEAHDCDCEPEADSCLTVSGNEETELISISDSGLQQDSSVTDRFDVSIPANGLASLPTQTRKIELLESSIEEAKNNKKTLFSSMEAVMNIMREVEAKENAVEKAQKEASKGGLEILSQAEELKAMLRKAKEANDMHAGEVYGERSILATEAKELQSRLANLTEERDTALCILDEMRCSLEMRLFAAEEEIRKAEAEKQDKENSAKKYLNEQEAIMNKIVQEAKLLQLEAEENSKLREFLVDRGRIVDILQGEIGVICQDVNSLKCKFDERVPLSESISSGQTTCILASSGTSKRSISSLVVSDQEAPSEATSPSRSPREVEMEGDGWEFLPALHSEF